MHDGPLNIFRQYTLPVNTVSAVAMHVRKLPAAIHDILVPDFVALSNSDSVLTHTKQQMIFSFTKWHSCYSHQSTDHDIIRHINVLVSVFVYTGNPHSVLICRNGYRGSCIVYWYRQLCCEMPAICLIINIVIIRFNYFIEYLLLQLNHFV